MDILYPAGRPHKFGAKMRNPILPTFRAQNNLSTPPLQMLATRVGAVLTHNNEKQKTCAAQVGSKGTESAGLPPTSAKEMQFLLPQIPKDFRCGLQS